MPRAVALTVYMISNNKGCKCELYSITTIQKKQQKLPDTFMERENTFQTICLINIHYLYRL